MELQTCGLNLNRAGKELQPHGTHEFPCAGYLARYTSDPEDMIPWHWHEELEVAYIKEGSLKLQVPAGVYHMRQGDCVVINGNIPHFAVADPVCELHSLVFSSLLITGNDDSVFARRYLQPLIQCPAFDGYLLKPAGNQSAIDSFIRAFEALRSDCPGWEFPVRSGLSDLCVHMYRQFEDQIMTGETPSNQDNIRIRKMLDYIHHNFADNLTLKDIAGTADIGERECLRCFQRTVRLSPMQYLLKYRVMQGATLLVSHPLSSISEISLLCGFDSPSNFAKMFKRFYLSTPRAFREESSISSS